MIRVKSALERKTGRFDKFRETLERFQFKLGGNWDYDHGYFDRALDGEAQKVWLRIPFVVTRGQLRGEETPHPYTAVEIGEPFVLRHVYNEGTDAEAEPRIVGAFTNQFQEPSDPDAEVGEQWVEKAESVLREVEQAFGVEG
jgi:hypothetical protein